MQVALVCNKVFGTDGISLFVLKNYHYFRHEEVKYHLIYAISSCTSMQFR